MLPLFWISTPAISDNHLFYPLFPLTMILHVRYPPVLLASCRFSPIYLGFPVCFYDWLTSEDEYLM